MMRAGERKIYIRWITLLLATVIALYLCWLMLMPFVEVLAWASVLVIIFYPIHLRIAARLERPSWSAALSTTLVIITFLVPLSLLTIIVMNEMPEIVQRIHGYISTLLDPSSPISGR